MRGVSTPHYETRVVISPTRGSRVCLVAGLLLLGAAAYLLLVPIILPTSTGAAFGCGSAANPAGGQFARSVCGDVNERNRVGAYGLSFAAVVVAAGGLWAFGTQRRSERRVVADTDEL
jgi:hypothetical protein